MYSLDVNFLKDREPTEPTTQTKRGPTITPGSTVPLIAGAVVGLLFPILAGGYWLFVKQEIAKVDQEIQEVDQKIAASQNLISQRDGIQQQVDGATAEANALATVFNQIKPWSSILNDLGKRIPPGVKIGNIAQEEILPEEQQNAAPVDPAAEGAVAPAPPLPTIQITVSGIARNFGDVNDFLIQLQNSKFLEPAQTIITKASLIDNPEQVEIPEELSDRVTIELPKVVSYEIQTQLNQIPASELTQELDKTGAVGLTRRISLLKEKGVL